MSTRCLPVLPIAAVFFLLGSMLGSYLFALLHKESIDYIPYPRDLATSQPERGIISAGLSVGGSITFSVILLRFAQVHTFYPRICFVSNICSFASGALLLVGLYIVPAFPYDLYPEIHCSGALSHFGFMVLFMATQTWISYKHPFNHTKCVARVRLAISVLSIVFPVTYVCGRLFAPEDQQRYYIPQASEWLLSLLFLVFLCTFAWDFSRINLRVNCYEVTPRSPISRSLLKNHRNLESPM